MSALAYISAFDGVTIVNGTTMKHRSLLPPTSVVLNRIVELPNGTLMNYDGSADPVLVPGVARQHIVISGSTATTLYDAIAAKQGLLGTITRSRSSNGNTSTASGICLSVIPMGSSKPTQGFIEAVIEFRLLGDWSSWA